MEENKEISQLFKVIEYKNIKQEKPKRVVVFGSWAAAAPMMGLTVSQTYKVLDEKVDTSSEGWGTYYLIENDLEEQKWFASKFFNEPCATLLEDKRANAEWPVEDVKAQYLKKAEAHELGSSGLDDETIKLAGRPQSFSEQIDGSIKMCRTKIKELEAWCDGIELMLQDFKKSLS